MKNNDAHYQALVHRRGRSRGASCGYQDRFDPFKLNQSPRVRGLYQRLFSTFLADQPSKSLLDAGCGTGVYFDVLSQFSEHIEAVDSSPEMIRVAREYCKETGLTSIHPHVGSAEALAYPDASFDTVIELDVLHHVRDLGKALGEIYRVLQPGGRFLVFEPNICNPLMFLAHVLPPEERRALRRNGPGRLKMLLTAYFDVVRCDWVCELISETRGLKNRAIEAYLTLWRVAAPVST
ncbi:MAG: class I SAM-dependent methyltransferase, partial [Candidatus Hydrogenedentota bacterium]